MSARVRQYGPGVISTAEEAKEAVLDSFVEAARDRMAALGLSQKDVANRMGVSQGRVSQLLRGYEDQRLETMVRLAAALGCRVSIALTLGGGR